MVDRKENAHDHGIVQSKGRRAATNGLSRRALLQFAGGSAVSAISSSAFAQKQPSEQWDELVRAATKEKTVTVATLTGNAINKPLEAFQKTFPGITVNRQAFSSNSLLIPKVIEEQAAGLYLRDLAIASTPNMLGQLKPRGALESVRELIIRPDVIGDQYWVSGFEAGFSDAEKRGYVPFASAYWPFWINTDLVPAGAIKSVNDLLRPEWKGKLVMPDFQNGATYGAMATIRTNLGEAAVKALVVDQRPTILRDMNQLVEVMVRGRFPIAIGVFPQALSQYTEQGLGKNLKRIDLPEARHVISTGGIVRFKNGPSPNAAKLFANWFLTRDAQILWSAALEENSRRTDVPPFNPEFTPVPGGNYMDYSKESNSAVAISTIRMLRELTNN